jgi:hypothetical protein
MLTITGPSSKHALKQRASKRHSTSTIHEGTFDISIQAHKKYKLVPTRANLRDHMTHLELALTSLSEATAITLHQDRESHGFSELKQDTVEAGEAGKEAREGIVARAPRSCVALFHISNFEGSLRFPV